MLPSSITERSAQALLREASHRWPSRLLLCLLAVTLAGVVVPSRPASAAGNGFSASIGTSFGVLNGSVAGSASSSNVVLHPVLAADGGRAGSAYSLDVSKPASDVQGAFSEQSATTASVKNLDRINWLITNSWPTISTADIQERSGLAFTFGLNNSEAALATQAAIWNLTNGWSIDRTAPLGWAGIRSLGINADDVVRLYDWLLSHAAPISLRPVTPLLIDTSRAVSSGGKFGPIQVTTRNGGNALISVTGEASLIVDQNPVGHLGTVISGGRFYLQGKDGTAVTITAKSSATLQVGTVVRSSSNNQGLLVAESKSFSETATTSLTIGQSMTSGGNPNGTPTDIALATTMVAPTGPVKSEEVLTWSVVATNKGPGVSSGVTIVDAVPQGFTSIYASMAQGNCVSDGGRKITCNSNGAIAVGDKRTMTIRAKAPASGCWSNTASMITQEPDPVLDNNTAGTATACISTQVPKIQLIKTAVIAGQNGPGINDKITVVTGESVDYFYQVSAQGSTEALKDVAVSDDLCAKTTMVSGDSNRDSLLQVNEKWLFKCTRQIHETTTAKATVTASAATASISVSATAATTVTVQQKPHPGLSLVREMSAIVDANSNGVQDAGDTVSFSYAVKNTGNVGLTPVLISDRLVGEVRCPKLTLEPAEAMTCVPKPYSLSAQDLQRGTLPNAATATGTALAPLPPAIATTSGESRLNVGPRPSPAPTTPEQRTGLAVQQKAELGDSNGNKLADPEEEITYTLTVTNTGTQPLRNVTVSSARLELSAAECVAQLEPGKSQTCKTVGRYRVKQADVDQGSVTQRVEASAMATDGKQVSAQPVDGSVPTINGAALTLTASVKPGSWLDANNNGVTDLGDTLLYFFVVANTGAQPVQGLQIDAPMLKQHGVSVSCESTVLKPGQSTSCTSQRYVLAEQDVKDGSVSNIATAQAMSMANTEIRSLPATTVTTIATPQPKISVQAKVADTDQDGIAHVAELLNYTVTVTNSGNVAVSNINVAEAAQLDHGKLEQILCAQRNLPAGASTTCNASYRVTQADLATSSIDVDVYATAKAGASDLKSTTVPTSIPTQSSAFTLALTAKANDPIDANGDGMIGVGDKLSFSFEVINAGTTTLSNIRINSPLLQAVSVAVNCPRSMLAPAEKMTCISQDYLITAGDQQSHVVNSTASVSGTTSDGRTISSAQASTQTSLGNAHGMLKLDVLANLNDRNNNHAADAGEVIDYRFKVSNIGNVALVNVKVVAAKLNKTVVIGNLAVGQSVTVPDKPIQYSLTQADADSVGYVITTATASGNEPSDDNGIGEAVPASEDTAKTPVAGRPNLELTKSVSLGSYTDVNGNGIVDGGDTIAYTFTVANKGDTKITDVTVTDAKLGRSAANAIKMGDLDPGQSKNLAQSPILYTITDADAASGAVNNTASAQGRLDGNTPISSNTSFTSTSTQLADVKLELSVVVSKNNPKHLGFSDAGEGLNYGFKVSNKGNVALSDIRLKDSRFNLIDAPCVAQLAPGESATCGTVAKYKVTDQDVAVGTITSSTVATAKQGISSQLAVSDPAYSAVSTAPSRNIALAKISNLDDRDGDGRADAGETITYRFVVINTGSSTIDKFTVNDESLSKVGIEINCPMSKLEPGDSVNCESLPYKVTQDDVHTGVVHNVATVSGVADGQTVTSGQSAADVATDSLPLVGLVKRTNLIDSNNNSIADVGEKVSYVFTVTNSGNVGLSAIEIDDPLLQMDDLKIKCERTELKPQESTQCTSASRVITADDVKATQLQNAATVRAMSVGGRISSAESHTTIATQPGQQINDNAGLSLTIKSQINDLNHDGVANAGESVIWQFIISNTGVKDLTDLKLDDPVLDQLGIQLRCPAKELRSGMVMSCQSGAFPVNLADVAAGGLKNAATISAQAGGKAVNSVSNEVETKTGISKDGDKRAREHEMARSGAAVTGLGLIMAMIFLILGAVLLLPIKKPIRQFVVVRSMKRRSTRR